MTVLGDLLFYGGFGRRASLTDVLRHNLETSVRDHVEQLREADFNTNDDASLAATIAAACKAEPIVLKLDKSTGGATPVRIMVNDFFGGQVSVDGLDVTKTIPFDGDPQLFELQPDQFDLNPPHGLVSGTTLTIGMQIRQSEVETAVRYVEETLRKIELYLGRQTVAIETYNAALPVAALAHIERRRAVLGNASEVARRLSGR